MPYDLARLGWLQFQRLCDLVLEEVAGLPAHAWSGDADGRREAVADGAIELGELALAGPVVVKARFLRRGVAPASVVPALVDAATSAGSGEPGPSLLVVTNAPLTGRGRASLRERLTGDPAGARVDVLDGERLGALVDELPGVRRALPSLLGVRELDGWLDRAVAERSSLDVGAAAALARVFVATRTHAAALEALDRRAFAVLTGLPEMGKTAIARMIALAQLSVGWEAHECLDPGELRRAFDPARPQVFVADDAFGSTEYRPDGAERWARALPELLPLLDDAHWLLWTSRPAPLRAGLARVRREEGFERFPSPVEVTVDADDLDADERALILLRHAGAAELPAPARRLVTAQGPAMVAHPQFTPERIRRLVAGLRHGPLLLSGVGGERAVAAAVRAALEVPSDGMRGSFRALSDEQRALLQVMLDQPPGPVPERELAAGLRRLRPGAHGDPHAGLSSLEVHFLRLHHGRAEWVHPSWRDVVIDDLAAREDERRAFLTACGLEGVALALSTGGGPAGTRRLPLLDSDADWDALGDRLGPLVRELDDDGLERLLRLLADTAQRLAGDRRAEVGALSERALRIAGRRWTGRAVDVDGLAAWWALAWEFPSPCAPPDPGPTWAELEPVRVPEGGRPEDLDRLDAWLVLAAVLAAHDPRTLARLGFPERRRSVLDATRESIAARSLTGPPAQLARIRDGIDELVYGRPRGTLDIPEEEIAPRRPAEPPPVASPGRIERILADLG